MVLLLNQASPYPFTFERPCPLCGHLISFTLCSREDLDELVCHECGGSFSIDPTEIEHAFGISLPPAETS